ncbi:unnamed protein product [Clonostachys rhizophaga]|uniref:Inhibitor I9 domain-containing protein n=1 Tax=Clonostachys rhizophaga TaxID=160324 RepID=A0A9N9VEB4_9HYPO|nr:unnamed protein product [Clonostachys rhizophaga]
MPTYIITCKENASDEDVKSTVDERDETDDRRRAKDHAIKQGGTIEHEYKIIKGFSVKFPEGAVTTLDSHPSIKAVEADGVMKIQ